MPWVVKVVARVRRPGQSAAQLESRLGLAEGDLAAGVVAAILPLEPDATIAWHMRVFPVPPGTSDGNNVYEVYPKLIVTLPRWEATPRPADPSAIFAALRACRDALIARLQTLANTANWTVIFVRGKDYDG